MSKQRRVAAQSEHLSVERRHVRLDVVEQEGLQQVRSVQLHVHLLEEVLECSVRLVDLFLDQGGRQLAQVVQVQRVNGLLTQTEALDWVQTVLRFVQVVHYHHSVSEVAVA